MGKESVYTELLQYYKRLFNLFDLFIFNSSNTRKVYDNYISSEDRAVVVPVTHSKIKDNRKYRNFNFGCVRLGFIGSLAEYKGFPMLLNVLNELNNDNITNWTLAVYGTTQQVDVKPLSSKIYFKGRFQQNQLSEIFDSMDALVVPSICNETFSLVALEALSYGVPVLVSDKVGAKDIVQQYSEHFIFTDRSDLYRLLKMILTDIGLLKDYNSCIMQMPWNYSIKEHNRQIENLYKTLLK